MKLPKFTLKRAPSKKSTTHGLKKWKEELDAAAHERHAAAAPAAGEGNKRRIARSRSSVDSFPDRADPHIQRYRDDQQVAAMAHLSPTNPGVFSPDR